MGWLLGIVLVGAATLLVWNASRDKYGYEDPKNAIDSEQFEGMWDGSSVRDKVLRDQEGVTPSHPPSGADGR